MIKVFSPERAIFEPKSLEYPLGKKIYRYFEGTYAEIIRAPIQKISSRYLGLQKVRDMRAARKPLLLQLKKA